MVRYSKKIVALLVLVCSLVICFPSEVYAGLSKNNYKKIYDTMLAHKTKYSFTMNGKINNLNVIKNKMISRQYNDSNNYMGDFAYYEGLVTYSVQGMYYPSTKKSNETLTFNWVYNASKSKNFSKKVKSSVNSLKLNKMSDYDKIKTINDYICKLVDYDNEAAESGEISISNTAYGALYNKKAVCQGYALLFYRMCKEVKIPVRFVIGTGYDEYNDISEAHAWNIVKVNGKWYNIDVTWNDTTNNSYFLLNSKDFDKTHFRSSYYKKSDFTKNYKIASKSLSYEWGN